MSVHHISKSDNELNLAKATVEAVRLCLPRVDDILSRHRFAGEQNVPRGNIRNSLRLCFSTDDSYKKERETYARGMNSEDKTHLFDKLKLYLPPMISTAGDLAELQAESKEQLDAFNDRDVEIDSDAIIIAMEVVLDRRMVSWVMQTLIWANQEDAGILTHVMTLARDHFSSTFKTGSSWTELNKDELRRACLAAHGAGISVLSVEVLEYKGLSGCKPVRPGTYETIPLSGVLSGTAQTDELATVRIVLKVSLTNDNVRHVGCEEPVHVGVNQSTWIAETQGIFEIGKKMRWQDNPRWVLNQYYASYAPQKVKTKDGYEMQQKPDRSINRWWNGTKRIPLRWPELAKEFDAALDEMETVLGLSVEDVSRLTIPYKGPWPLSSLQTLLQRVLFAEAFPVSTKECWPQPNKVAEMYKGPKAVNKKGPRGPTPPQIDLRKSRYAKYANDPSLFVARKKELEAQGVRWNADWDDEIDGPALIITLNSFAIFFGVTTHQLRRVVRGQVRDCFEETITLPRALGQTQNTWKKPAGGDLELFLDTSDYPVVAPFQALFCIVSGRLTIYSDEKTQNGRPKLRDMLIAHLDQTVAAEQMPVFDPRLREHRLVAAKALNDLATRSDEPYASLGISQDDWERWADVAYGREFHVYGRKEAGNPSVRKLVNSDFVEQIALHCRKPPRTDFLRTVDALRVRAAASHESAWTTQEIMDIAIILYGHKVKLWSEDAAMTLPIGLSRTITRCLPHRSRGAVRECLRNCYQLLRSAYNHIHARVQASEVGIQCLGGPFLDAERAAEWNDAPWDHAQGAESDDAESNSEDLFEDEEDNDF